MIFKRCIRLPAAVPCAQLLHNEGVILSLVGHQASRAVLDAFLRIAEMAAAVRPHPIEGAVAEQAVEVVCILCLVTGEILAAPIREEGVVLLRKGCLTCLFFKEFLVHSDRHVKQIPDPLTGQHLLRRSAEYFAAFLYAQESVADFQRQIDLVQGHQDRLPFCGKSAQGFHQLRPVADIQVRGGLIHEKDRRLLRKRPRHKHPLLLPVADRAKIPLRKVLHLHAGHRAVHCLLVFLAKDSHASRIGVTARRAYFAAGHVFRPDRFRQDDRYSPCSLFRIAFCQILTLHQD